MIRLLSLSIAGAVFSVLLTSATRAERPVTETIQTPMPEAVQVESSAPEEVLGDAVAYPSSEFQYPSSGGVHIFPAVLATRRYGPVEEPDTEWYSLRNAQEPGFNWSGGLTASGWGWGGGYGYPGYGFGLVGYNRYYYRPWYTSPTSQVWSNKFPWYSPGGLGPNIYQPWYLWPNRLPWYTPYGIGPNIYQPSYTWRSYYPWYSPYGAGPNIYTPWWQSGVPASPYGGCLYW